MAGPVPAIHAFISFRTRGARDTSASTHVFDALLPAHDGFPFHLFMIPGTRLGCPDNGLLTIFGQPSSGEFGGADSMKNRWMATKVAAAKLDASLERAVGEFSPRANERESFGRISAFIAQARALAKNSDQN